MDLDRERDAVLQLLGFLIEVLAELPDGDSFLDGEKWWWGWGGGWRREGNKHGKRVEDCFKMYELLKKFSQASLMSHCAARIQMPVLLSVNQSIRNLQRSDCIHT